MIKLGTYLWNLNSLQITYQRSFRSLERDRAFVHLDTKSYLAYLEVKLETMSEIAHELRDFLDLESFSGLSLLSYCLNSLMHSPDYHQTDSRNYVKENNCPKNRLCFLPSSFATIAGKPSFTHQFDPVRMRLNFPDATIMHSSQRGVFRETV